MIEIRNLSGEPYVVETRLDPSAPGFRLDPSARVPDRELAPDRSEVQLGYEPGVWIRVRPVHGHERPRAPSLEHARPDP